MDCLSEADLPVIYCCWSKREDVYLSLIRFDDLAEGKYSHSLQISLSDQLYSLVYGLECMLEVDQRGGLSQTQRIAIDQYFIRGISCSPLLPSSALSEFLKENNQSDLSSVVQMEFANRKLYFETVGSEMTETELYLSVWKDTILTLLHSISFVWSMDIASSTLLLAHWHGITRLSPLRTVESLNFFGLLTFSRLFCSSRRHFRSASFHQQFARQHSSFVIASAMDSAILDDF